MYVLSLGSGEKHMEKDRGFWKNIKKKAVAVTAAVSLLIGGQLTSPAELPEKDVLLPGNAVVDTLLPEPEPVPEPPEELTDEPEEEKKRRQKLPLYKRLAVFAGFLLADWLIIAVVSSLLAALPAVLATVLTCLSGVAVTAILGIAALKLSHPGTPLKELLCRKNITAGGIILASLGVIILLVRFLIPEDSVYSRIVCPATACIAFVAMLWLSSKAS